MQYLIEGKGILKRPRAAIWTATAVALALLAGTACAEDEGSTTRDRFICRSTTEVREIKTYVASVGATDAAEPFGCRVDYTKNGVTQTVWSSSTSRSYCDGKAQRLAARLAAGNFTCESLTGAVISR